VRDHDLVKGLIGYPQRFPLGAFLETDKPDFISVVKHLALRLRMPRRQSDNDLAKGAGRKNPFESQREVSALPAPRVRCRARAVSALGRDIRVFNASTRRARGRAPHFAILIAPAASSI